ncbi:hypothetical protein EJ08DRAFT_698509 [Tothia fuscella]|uniref:Uncharacterized protein n=1 Tax=Tothia fuscella TaxID=1048955 RepID=A0A9P4NNK7_9PEZI|nr:hypothetical protein EJ08DRAFT_698509 [Tothia fuscella]
MDLFALSKLVVFGGEISRRLISFAKKIDEAPSSIRSIGFEIRSTCDVLNELHGVLKRQQNERMSSISTDALEEIQEAFDKCDEIIYEVGQGVLRGHEKLKVAPVIDELYIVSIQERVLWPLLQPRLYSLVADLSDAKMDIVLHLLVLQVRSERFYGRRMDVPLFSTLTRQQREETIAQLWHNKMQRDPEPSGYLTSGAGHVSPGEGGSPVLQRLNEESSESDNSDAESDSDSSEKRGRSIFRRIVRRLSGSKDKKHCNSQPNSLTRTTLRRNGTIARPTMGSKAHSERPALGRSRSSSAKSTSEHSSNSSGARSWNSSTSTAPPSYPAPRPSFQQRPSLLSITNPRIVILNGGVQRVKSVSWKHGPTMSAKRGIELEWDALKMDGDWDEGTGSDERRLGHQLLLSQLSSRVALPRRDTLSTPAIVDMLVSRWTTSPSRREVSYIGTSPTLSGISQFSLMSGASSFYSAGGDERDSHQHITTPTLVRQLLV